MEPNYKDGRFYLVNKLSYIIGAPKRGDVVAVKSNEGPPAHPQRYILKRIIALPGETVEIRNGDVLINGTYLHEPYTSSNWAWNEKKTVVDGNHYYVLGDNRSVPIDQHLHGLVKTENLVGKIIP